MGGVPAEREINTGLREAAPSRGGRSRAAERSDTAAHHKHDTFRLNCLLGLDKCSRKRRTFDNYGDAVKLAYPVSVHLSLATYRRNCDTAGSVHDHRSLARNRVP